ncbi:hypothetical protein [Roseateles sp. P5_E1]
MEVQNILTLARDASWGLVGAIAAVIGLMLTWLYRQNRPVRELAFGIVSSRRLLSVHEALSNRVTMFLDGQPVDNVHSILFALKNSGNQPIRPNEFHRSLEITFSAGEIISVEGWGHPKQVECIVSLNSEQSIVLESCLVNPGEELLIHVLFSAPKVDYQLHYRIEGITNLHCLNRSQPLPPYWQSGAPLMLVITAVMFFSTYMQSRQPDVLWYLVGISVIALAASLYQRGRDLISARRRISSEAAKYG